MAGTTRDEPRAPGEFDRETARPIAKGRAFEDFEVGQVFEHHWGRTLNAGDNSLFSAATMHFNPLYFNAEYARAHGHPDLLINPMLVLSTAVGLSVEDLSEGGGPFLGVDDLTFHRSVHPGDTLTAVTRIGSIRERAGRTGRLIFTILETKVTNQRDETVVVERTTLIAR